MSVRARTGLIAAAVAVIVLFVTIWAQAPVGAGVYYDDGAYLALARSLAQGEGYVYSNLPDPVPGVKYPPVYPVVLAGLWKALDAYPENLAALKALNALFWGLAAGGVFLLFAKGSASRRLAAGAVAVYAFLTVPSMAIATVLMAEPLFLLLCVGALLVAGLGSRDGSLEVPSPEAEGTDGLGGPSQSTATAFALGALAALAFLTRSIGITLVVSLVVPLLLHRYWRTAGLVTGVAAIPAVAWLAWAGGRASEVPDALAGQYGSYGAWVERGFGGGAIGRVREILSANWDPFIETLQFVWAPRASGWALALLLLAFGVVIAYSLPRIWRRNPALALFPFAYLGIVFAWPYEPYRFYYAIVPLLTLFAFEGLWELVPKLRKDSPRWGVAVGLAALFVVAANALIYQARGHAIQVWTSSQTLPAVAYAPLNDWIRENTPPDEVIASALDPYVHWETGRPAVPSWRFLADDYGRYDRSPAVLAEALDSIIVQYDARYVALILGENKAARTLEAFVQLHPERTLKVVETPGPVVGVIYELAPPGQSLRDPEADALEEPTATEPEDDGAPDGLEPPS